MINKCIVCGKKFEAKKSTKLYCSDSCMYKARTIRKHTNNSPRALIERVCLLCGKSFTPKNAASNGRSCCYECMPEGHQLTRGEFIKKIKIARGGKCECCGYDKCLGALEFHHIDPTQKDFTISDSNFQLKRAIEESKKCIMLCSNCHREVHEEILNARKEEVSDGINQ